MTPRAPLIRLLLERPQLLTEHLAAYVDLLAAEASALLAWGERRVLLQMLAAGLLAAAVGLAGVAVMLRAALSVGSAPAALAPGTLSPAELWLLAVPLLTALGAWAAWRAARHGRDDPPFARLREQLQADLAVLREAAGPSDPP